MIEINANICIQAAELTWSFARSGGPGGQNVNKVNSKATLRWRIADNSTIPAEAVERLHRQQRRRITNEGELLLTSQRYRDQERNRGDCVDKLRNVVLRALQKPKARKKTKPSRSSKEARLRAKKHRSRLKDMRRDPAD